MAGKAASGGGTIRKKTIEKNGKQYVYWEGRLTIGNDPGTGKQIQKSFSGKTQKEVREKLQAAAVAVNENDYIEPTKYTVAKWLDIWLAEYMGDKKYLTVKKYQSVVDLHLKPRIGNIKLSELSPIHIQKLYNALQKTDAKGKQNMGKEGKTLSSKTVHLIHGVLSKALSVAVQQGILRNNPAERVILPKMTKKEINPLTDEQVKEFLKAADEDEYGDILKLILFTGLREAEAVGLTWDVVDFQNSTLRISKQLQSRKESDGGYTYTSLKNDKIRMLTVPPFVMDLLKHQKEKQILDRFAAGEMWLGWKDAKEMETAPVFTKPNGEHIVIAVLYRHFKKIAEKIGSPDSRVHDLRHTYAVLSLQNEDSIKTVQEALGHATASFTLDVYGHVSEKMKRESADKMQQYIQSVTK